MNVRKFALTILIFTVLFTNGMQCRDSEERLLRRNEKKLRRQERSRRLRNRQKVVTGIENVFYSEILDITPVIPVETNLQRLHEVVREATRLQRQMAHNRLQNQQAQQQAPQNEAGQMTTTTDEATTITTPTSVDNANNETNTSNITWSGDHDLMSINNTYNDTYLSDDSTFSAETLGNETNSNRTSTPKPPGATLLDSSLQNYWRGRIRYVSVPHHFF